MDLEEYISSFSPTIMEIVASWAEGARFMDILKGSKILEVRELAGNIAETTTLQYSFSHMVAFTTLGFNRASYSAARGTAAAAGQCSPNCRRNGTGSEMRTCDRKD